MLWLFRQKRGPAWRPWTTTWQGIILLRFLGANWPPTYYLISPHVNPSVQRSSDLTVGCKRLLLLLACLALLGNEISLWPCLSIRPVGLSVGWSVCLPVFAKRGGKIHSHAPIRALLLYFALSSFMVNFRSIFIFDWDGHFSKKLSEDNCCVAKDNHVQEMTDLEEEIAGTYDQE